MIVAFTGHRPLKIIGSYSTENNPKYDQCCDRIREALYSLNPSKVISGMALGVDIWAAEICVEMEIPFIAAIPFVGQERMWSYEAKQQYNSLLRQAEEVKVVCEGRYHASKMQIRNEWMVDNADEIIAVWDGSSGGTSNCVKYAKEQGKKIYRIDPSNRFEPEL